MAISGQAKQQKGPAWPTDLLANGPLISSANSETLAALRAWNRAKPAVKKDGLTGLVHMSAAHETWYRSFCLWVKAFTGRRWAALEGAGSKHKRALCFVESSHWWIASLGMVVFKSIRRNYKGLQRYSDERVNKRK